MCLLIIKDINIDFSWWPKLLSFHLSPHAFPVCPLLLAKVFTLPIFLITSSLIIQPQILAQNILAMYPSASLSKHSRYVPIRFVRTCTIQDNSKFEKSFFTHERRWQDIGIVMNHRKLHSCYQYVQMNNLFAPFTVSLVLVVARQTANIEFSDLTI